MNKQIVFGFFILFYLLKSMKMRQSKQKAKNMLLVLIVTYSLNVIKHLVKTSQELRKLPVTIYLESQV